MVGQIIVIYDDSVLDYLDELTHTLYKKEYFGFLGTAQKYVDKITLEIDAEIHRKTHHASPERLIKHGKYYIKVKGSHRTMWYIFFDKKDNRYFVAHITNNHVATAEFLQDL